MTYNHVIQVDRRARVVFPSDSPSAYTDLANEVDRLNAKNAALEAEVSDLTTRLRDTEKVRDQIAMTRHGCG